MTNTTPNAFLTRGAPTFVVGTAGDAHATRLIAGQAAFMQVFALPAAAVMTDTDALAAWPDHAVVYGGPHVNALVAKLAPCLPFTLTAGRLEIGGQRFDGEEHVLAAVIPARAAAGDCPGHPEFLLYAGTGTPGITEMNTSRVTKGDAPIAIADAFGQVTTGTWSADGAVLAAPQDRSGWTRVQIEKAGVAITIATPASGAPGEDKIAAVLRGVEHAVGKLGLDGKGLRITIYLHADRAAKTAATGFAADGHATAYARSLHVRADPSAAALERLIAHEATHVLLPQTWGATGSPLFAEGVAVWVAGTYQGKPLAEWNAKFGRTSPVATLIGPAFLTLDEPSSYPAAALIVEAIVNAHGLAMIRDHLYSATVHTWPAACAAAGTTPEDLDRVIAAHLAR